jgi:hypothetical protein
LQIHHFTNSHEDFVREKNSPGSRLAVYPCGVSRVDNDWRNRSFVNVWNKGTKEYTNRISVLMNKIPFQKLLDDLCEDEVNTKRGNYQYNYGFASGHCQQTRNVTNVQKHFGAAIPSLRVGTKENLPLLRTLTQLAKEIGMEVTKEEFLSDNHDVAEELRLVETEIGEGVVHALVSVCFTPLDKGISKVLDHTDEQNGRKAAQVMVAASTLLDKNGEYVLVLAIKKQLNVAS